MDEIPNYRDFSRELSKSCIIYTHSLYRIHSSQIKPYSGSINHLSSVVCHTRILRLDADRFGIRDISSKEIYRGDFSKDLALRQDARIPFGIGAFTNLLQMLKLSWGWHVGAAAARIQMLRRWQGLSAATLQRRA